MPTLTEKPGEGWVYEVKVVKTAKQKLAIAAARLA